MNEKLGDSGKDSKARDAVKPNLEEANPYAVGDAGEFAKNMMRVGQQSQKLLTDFFKRQSAGSKEPLDPLNIAEPFLTLIKAMTANPTALVDAQFQLWKEFLGLVGGHRPQDAGRRGRAGGCAARRRQAVP